MPSCLQVVVFSAIVAAIGSGTGCGGSDISRAVGARCDVDSECDDRCQSDDDYPGGFCTVGCDTESDCPNGTACIDRDSGICLFECTEEEDQACAFLGIGWRCEMVSAQGDGEVAVCIGDL